MGAGPHISEDQLIEVIERITEGNGMSLKASCEISGFYYTNVVRRIRASETLRELHAQAREDYAALRVAEMHEIARTEPDVQRARLMCDNIKWEASKVAPKVYGDKFSADISGTVSLETMIAAAANAPPLDWSPPPRLDKPTLSVIDGEAEPAA